MDLKAFCFAILMTVVHYTGGKELIDTLERYEVVHPKQITANVRNRKDSSTETLESKHRDHAEYIIKRSKDDFHIHLHRNRDMLPETSQVWLESDMGLEQIAKAEQCHYHGRLHNDPGSSVRMSTCDNHLSGVIKTSKGEDYHIAHVQLKDGKNHHILFQAQDIKKDEQNPIISEPLLDTEKTKRHSSRSRKRRSSPLSGQYEKQTKYVSLLIAADSTMLEEYGDPHRLTNRLVEIVNIADEVYFEAFNTRIVLSYVVIQQTKESSFTVSNSLSSTLSSFSYHNKNTYYKSQLWDHDAAVLISNVNFDGTPVGLAYFGTICQLTASSVIQNFHSIGVVNTLTHELGHNLYLQHTSCDHESCVMGTSRYSLTRKFSSSNLQTFKSKLDDGKYDCLLDAPTRVFRHVCGDGIVDSGEQCDCGSVEECAKHGLDKCCDAAKCTLKEGMKCAHGPCCKSDCQFVTQGTICRAKDNECDLPEFCNGKSGECPHNLYIQDGTKCQAGGLEGEDASSYCYNGECNTLQKACKNLYGSAVTVGTWWCADEMNYYGDEFGNCGPIGQSGAASSTKIYTPCEYEDVYCGKLWCSRSGYKQGTPNLRTYDYYGECVASSETLSFGQAWDRTYPRDGTKCEENKVCVNLKCKSLTELKMDKKCNCKNGGVCNSNGECHCPAGFACPYCEEEGPGGSFSAGSKCSKPKDECTDVFISTDTVSCATMKSEGFCKSKPEFMKFYCEKTCFPECENQETKVCPMLSEVQGRCGPLYGRCNKLEAAWAVYCNTRNGWCGDSDAHRDAQEGDMYDFKTTNCSILACIPLSTTKGRCGPQYGRCDATESPTSIYCNLNNHWCGNTLAHQLAQPSDAYDWKASSCEPQDSPLNELLNSIVEEI